MTCQRCLPVVVSALCDLSDVEVVVGDERITLRVSAAERAEWQAAAGGELVPLGRWVRQVVNERVRVLAAAGRGAGAESRGVRVSGHDGVLAGGGVVGASGSGDSHSRPSVQSPAAASVRPDDDDEVVDVEYEPFEETP